MVHADMSTYNNVCISPGSPCAGRIADLEAQLAAASSAAPAMPPTAAPAGPSPELLAAQARIADLEAQLAAPTAAPTACAATPARVADLENQYAKHHRLIEDICRSVTAPELSRIRGNANAWGVSLPGDCIMEGNWGR